MDVPPPGMDNTPTPSPEPGQGEQDQVLLNGDHGDSYQGNVRRSSLEEIESSNYASLCYIIVEVAPLALRHVFNGIHPPLHLVADLQKTQTQMTLRRLRQHGIIDDKQWKLLFPHRKSAVTSDKFDVVLLHILLKYVSSLSAPYPGGWKGVPIHGDKSITADMTRINWFRTLLASKAEEGRVANKEFQGYYSQLSSTLDRLGGVNCKIKMDRLGREKLGEEEAGRYLKKLEGWEEAVVEINSKEAVLEKLAKKRESGQHELANLLDHSHLQLGEEEDTSISRQNSSVRDSSAPASAYTDSRSVSTVTRSSTTASTRHSSPRRKTSRVNTASTQVTENQSGRAHWLAGIEEIQCDNPELQEQLCESVTEEYDVATHERNILLQFYKPLTESVKSEDVVGKMVQRGVLSHEEKNRISLAPRNLERMKMVVELIPKKGPKAFEKFLDVIKYKYKSLFDELSKAKQAPFIEEKPDEMTQCSNALRSQYAAQYSKISPIAWNKNATTKFEDFYERPYITDHNGECYDSDKFFDGHKKSENPRKVLLEGASGSGKTLLCQRLAYLWSQGENLFTRRRHRLVFYLQLRRVKGSVAEAVLEQCLPLAWEGDAEEVHTLLEANHADCLFLLDGYDDLKTDNNDIWELIEKKLYPRSSIILTTNPELFNATYRRCFDTKLTLHGLPPDAQEELIRRYADISGNSVETYAGLLAKVINEYDTTVRVLSLNPLYCLCMCLINETFGNLDFNTVSFMLHNFLHALLKFNCKQKRVPVADDVIPDDVKLIANALCMCAYKTLVENDVVFQRERLVGLAEYQTWENLFQLGLLDTYTHHPGGGTNRGKEHVFYTNKVFHEFMAAKHMSSMEPEDCIAMKGALTSEPHLHKMAAFYCGIHRFDYNLRSMREMFELISQNNREHWKLRHVRQEGSVVRNEAANQKAEGRLEDFRLGLECLCECEGRKDVIDFITESLPRRLYSKHKDRQTIQMIGGLAHVIKQNKPCVNEIELRLDHVGGYYEYTMMLLADALEKSTQVNTLKLRWTREDLLALFIANIFGKNESIKSLKISDESLSGLPADGISATVWSNLRSAGNNMIHVKNLALNHCKNPAFNSSLIRNLRGDYETLSLNGSKLDLVGAQDLAARIEKSKIMQILNLNCVRMSSADFLNICYGLRLNRSVTELFLADNQMDNAKVAALGDALKFNGTMKRIDLSHNSLTEEQCKMLGQALGVNSRLMEVQLRECKMTDDGARTLRRLKRESLVISGLGDKGLLTRYTFGRAADKTEDKPPGSSGSKR